MNAVLTLKILTAVDFSSQKAIPNRAATNI